VGSVEGHSPGNFGRYSEVGIQFLAEPEVFPRIRKGARNFISWMGTPAFRPLAAVSQPNYADPDHWKPFHLTRELARKAYASFHSIVGIRLECSSDTVRHDYSDKLILPGRRAHRSAKGDILLELRTIHTCNDIQVRSGRNRSGSYCTTERRSTLARV
jgi:hypothetical protein